LKFKLIKTLLVLMFACLLITTSFVFVGCVHQGPLLNIGNNFPETVTVYFNGHDVAIIQPGKTKILYPSDIAGPFDLLIEIKGSKDKRLFSKTYTSKDIIEIANITLGDPYWIGPETK
jgi:hypothetical protein